MKKALVFGAIALFVISVGIVWVVQTRLVFSRASEYAAEGMESIFANLEYQIEPELCRFAQEIVTNYGTLENAKKVDFAALARNLHIDEINLVDIDGIVVASSDPKSVGFDIKADETDAEFMKLNSGQHFVTQFFRRPPNDPDGPYRKYVGIAFLSGGGFVQIGDSIHANDALRRDYVFVQSAEDEHTSYGGYFVIVDPKTGKVLSSVFREKRGADAADAGLVGLKFPADGGPAIGVVFGEPSLVWRSRPDFFEVDAHVVFPLAEILAQRNGSVAITAIVLLLVFVVAGVLIGRIIRQGEQLKRFYAEGERLRQRDLALAKDIQSSALPSVFPPFPDRMEIDLYAYMRTAREVGGDFYDFYFISPQRLCMVIADVSGKGVPAALFMMKSKAAINSCVTTRASLTDAMEAANSMLCANNAAEMFVTAWVGIVDLERGELEWVSAGHNPPYLIRKDGGKAERLVSHRGLVLAAMDGIKYRSQKIALNVGDRLFFYTDGVSEAVSNGGGFFGERRIEQFLDSLSGVDSRGLCSGMVAAVDAFAAGAPQADDITVMSFARVVG